MMRKRGLKKGGGIGTDLRPISEPEVVFAVAAIPPPAPCSMREKKSAAMKTILNLR